MRAPTWQQIGVALGLVLFGRIIGPHISVPIATAVAVVSLVLIFLPPDRFIRQPMHSEPDPERAT